MESIKVENLSFSYPNATCSTLTDISFHVEAGEFVVLMGATGSGKSTLMRLLKRELAPLGQRAGRILRDGALLESMDAAQSAWKTGYVMQRPEQQIVTDKVWHELAFALENMGLPQSVIRRRVAEMASYFGISDWFERSVDSLSGGQKQLLNLAAAMVTQPDLLLLDEPTSQLDPIAASDFLNTVHKLNQEMGLTVLIIEHRLEEALPMADRVLVLERGRLLLDDTPGNVCQKPHMSASLLDAMPGAVRLFHALGGDGTCPITVRDGRRYLRAHYPICAAAPANSIPARSKQVALAFKNVYFRYGRECPDVLQHFNFDLRAGEVCCVLGANGSGKSTFLKLAAGLERPYCGSVRVFGKKVQDYRGQSLYRDCVSILPQDVQTVFLKNSVREELEDAHIRPEELPYSLEHLLNRHPYDLSGGEQQLVALAKALAMHPRLLMLDEPTKGVDVHSQKAILDILRNLKARGTAILVVTHDVEFAAKCADRCALFFRGEVVSEDVPRRFFDENSFYTTAANRICRGWFAGVATVEDAAECCKICEDRP